MDARVLLAFWNANSPGLSVMKPFGNFQIGCMTVYPEVLLLFPSNRKKTLLFSHAFVQKDDPTWMKASTALDPVTAETQTRESCDSRSSNLIRFVSIVFDEEDAGEEEYVAITMSYNLHKHGGMGPSHLQPDNFIRHQPLHQPVCRF